MLQISFPLITQIQPTKIIDSTSVFQLNFYSEHQCLEENCLSEIYLNNVKVINNVSMCWMNVSEGIYAWYFKPDRFYASVCFTCKCNENKIKDNNKRSIYTLRKERWANIFATFSALWPSLRKSSSSGMFFLASSTNHMNAKSGKSQWTTLTNTFE